MKRRSKSPSPTVQTPRKRPRRETDWIIEMKWPRHLRQRPWNAPRGWVSIAERIFHVPESSRTDGYYYEVGYVARKRPFLKMKPRTLTSVVRVVPTLDRRPEAYRIRNIAIGEVIPAEALGL